MVRLCIAFVCSALVCSAATAEETIWAGQKARVQLLAPELSGPAKDVVPRTLDRYLGGSLGWKMPAGKGLEPGLVNVVVGNAANNATLKALVAGGLDLKNDALGDEGFRIFSHEADGKRMLIVTANTPRGLKHGCQELMYFRVHATADRATVEWPMDVTMKPRFAYRGIYMLPIWSAYDSLESWQRVLEFNSELTLNRVWFWLDGFPVAGHPVSAHGVDYHLERTPLASDKAVQGLIDLVNSEGMKFYIGGGWLSWHHWEVVKQDREKAREYYFDYLRTFKGVGGFYFEPTGEGEERADWLPGDSLEKMIVDLQQRDPELEAAVAIGAFNNADYLKIMAKADPKRTFWWWCWGDPLKDGAVKKYPSVLGWHTTAAMSNFHGKSAPPSEKDLPLKGFATSYDPGMGYGNPWNGWAKMGVYEPRNFDPYTMPYFSHEYRFRERCWNVDQTDAEFAARLGTRLFDADMPAGAIKDYLKLADWCANRAGADAAELARIATFVKSHAGKGTVRNRDTMKRMREAVEGVGKTRKAAGK